MSTVLAVSAGTHQSFLNENTCTYIMLWSSGMKLVAFPDARPDAVLLLLAAIGLAVLLLICNTHNTHKAWAIRKPLHTQNASWCVQRQRETCHMFRSGHVQPGSMTNAAQKKRERERGRAGERERERERERRYIERARERDRERDR